MIQTTATKCLKNGSGDDVCLLNTDRIQLQKKEDDGGRAENEKHVRNERNFLF